jgi:UDP-sulfoquinovose synthase
VLNQFTERFSVNQLAEHVQRVGRSMGFAVDIRPIENPRKEAEEHYYNPAHSSLLQLGLQPHFLTDEVMADMLRTVAQHKDGIDPAKVLPRVRWKS